MISKHLTEYICSSPICYVLLPYKKNFHRAVGQKYRLPGIEIGDPKNCKYVNRRDKRYETTFYRPFIPTGRWCVNLREIWKKAKPRADDAIEQWWFGARTWWNGGCQGISEGGISQKGAIKDGNCFFSQDADKFHTNRHAGMILVFPDLTWICASHPPFNHGFSGSSS
jgi:hypothetical protein